jgi:hypothetical protein
MLPESIENNKDPIQRTVEMLPKSIENNSAPIQHTVTNPTPNPLSRPSDHIHNIDCSCETCGHRIRAGERGGLDPVDFMHGVIQRTDVDRKMLAKLLKPYSDRRSYSVPYSGALCSLPCVQGIPGYVSRSRHSPAACRKQNSWRPDRTLQGEFMGRVDSQEVQASLSTSPSEWTEDMTTYLLQTATRQLFPDVVKIMQRKWPGVRTDQVFSRLCYLRTNSAGPYTHLIKTLHMPSTVHDHFVLACSWRAITLERLETQIKGLVPVGFRVPNFLAENRCFVKLPDRDVYEHHLCLCKY